MEKNGTFKHRSPFPFAEVEVETVVMKREKFGKSFETKLAHSKLNFCSRWTASSLSECSSWPVQILSSVRNLRWKIFWN